MMFDRRLWIEILIVGMTGGIAAAAAVVGAQLANDPGDVLGFFGGAVGAGLAVIGGMWLDQRKEDISKRRNQMLLYDVLVTIVSSSDDFESAEEGQVTSKILATIQNMTTYEVIRNAIGVDNARAYVAFSAINYWFPIRTKDLQEILDKVWSKETTRAAAKDKAAPIMSGIYLSAKALMDMENYWIVARSPISARPAAA